MLGYNLNTNSKINCGLEVETPQILKAVVYTNKILSELPKSLYLTIDYKTTSALIGRIFCESIVLNVKGAMINPIEKGHPDIIPISAKDASETDLRNYKSGLEIKCTIGNIKSGLNLRAGYKRLEGMTGITWQAHHQEVTSLLGLIWDFANKTSEDVFHYPAITGVFFAFSLTKSDWGAISGTTGRNTKVCGMKASGRKKMATGWVLIEKESDHIYRRLLG